jgi:hypothetical protein
VVLVEEVVVELMAVELLVVMVHLELLLSVFLPLKHRQLFLYNTALSASTPTATSQSQPPII